jgi:hypothetical protein
MRFKVVVILVALTMTLGPGCTKADSGDDTRPADRAPKTAPTTTSTTPEAVITDGKEVSVGLDGTTVTVPAGSAPGGSRIVISSATAPQPADQFPGDAVDINIDAELTGPVTIVMAYDPDDLEPDIEPMLYTWVPETSSWLPQAATVDPKRKTLSATTQHLSTWTWGTPYYLWGKVTGDRTDPPTCSAKAPSWVKNFDHQDDPNAAVTSCIENAGDKLRLKLRANRGIPILVEFTTPVTVVDGSLESKTITAETLKRWPNRVYIGARQELIVTFPNPNRVVAISAKRWGGAATRFGLYAITTFYEQSIGADGKLNVLPQVLQCMWDIKELSDANNAADATGSVLSALTSCIERQLEGLRASGFIDGVQFTRLSQAFGYWKFADEFTKAVDTGFFDGDDDKYAYLSILTRKPPSAPPRAARSCLAAGTAPGSVEAAIAYLQGHLAGTPLANCSAYDASAEIAKLMRAPSGSAPDADVWQDVAFQDDYTDNGCEAVSPALDMCVIAWRKPNDPPRDGFAQQIIAVYVNNRSYVIERVEAYSD